MKIIWRGVLFLLLVSVSISNAASIYKWVDKDGSVNFTDDLNKVPPEYRNQIQMEETEISRRPKYHLQPRHRSRRLGKKKEMPTVGENNTGEKQSNHGRNS